MSDKADVTISKFKGPYSSNVFGMYFPLLGELEHPQDGSSSDKRGYNIEWMSCSTLVANLISHLNFLNSSSEDIQAPEYKEESRDEKEAANQAADAKAEEEAKKEKGQPSFLELQKLASLLMAREVGMRWPRLLLADLVDLLGLRLCVNFDKTPEVKSGIKSIEPQGSLRFGVIESILISKFQIASTMARELNREGLIQLLNDSKSITDKNSITEGSTGYSTKVMVKVTAEVNGFNFDDGLIDKLAEIWDKSLELRNKFEDGMIEIENRRLCGRGIVLQLIYIYIKTFEYRPDFARYGELVHEFLDQFMFSFGPYLKHTAPLGLLKTYKQNLTHLDEGYGPVLRVVSVQPRELLEIVNETTNTQVTEQEEIVEITGKSSSSLEQKKISDITSESASRILESSSIAIGVKGGGSMGVFSASGSLSTNSAIQSELAEKTVSKKVEEVTRKVAEEKQVKQISKVRSAVSYSETNLERRQITNSDKAETYALRQILRNIKVDLYHGSPRFIWNLYLSDPAKYLVDSKYLRFTENEGVFEQLLELDQVPAPNGGKDRKVAQISVQPDGTHAKVTFPFTMEKGKQPIAIENVRFRELGRRRGRRKSKPPAQKPTVLVGEGVISISPDTEVDGDPRLSANGGYKAIMRVSRPDIWQVEVTCDVLWEPSSVQWERWEKDEKLADLKDLLEYNKDAFTEAVELLEAKSRVKARLSEELRAEERIAVMQRFIGHVYGDYMDAVTPGEMESARQFFEVDNIFTYVHPTWWDTSLTGKDYELNENTNPAALGSSLGWKIQLDGDIHRNYFLNSPWVQVCVPIAPGYFKEAIAWLIENVEGEIVAGDLSGLETRGELVKAIDESVKEIEKDLLKRLHETDRHMDDEVLPEEALDYSRLILDQLDNYAGNYDFSSGIGDKNGTVGVDEVKSFYINKDKQFGVYLRPFHTFNVIEAVDGLGYQKIKLDPPE